LMVEEMAKDAICLEYRNIAIDIEEIKMWVKFLGKYKNIGEKY
jgi:hypothetical protein